MILMILGMAIGALSTIVPNYNAEVAPPEVRGSMVSLQQLAITAGIMISFWINYGTNYIGGTGAEQSDAAWLVPICLQLIPGLILGVGMIFMPFSPRWLIGHGRDAEARRVLSKLRNLDEGHELIELEYLEVKAQAEFDKRSVAEKFPGLEAPTFANTAKLQLMAFASLFQSKAMFRRVIIAGGVMFFQVYSPRDSAVVPLTDHQQAIHRYQRGPLLRPFHLRSLGPLIQHHQSPRHRRRRRSHVPRHHFRRPLHRQLRPQAHHDRRRHRHGLLPFRHLHHLRPQ